MPEVGEYTIGWICALSKELIAARAFLDIRHDPDDNAAINDDNNYTQGSIGKHNVVIAVLPYGQYGLVNAAAALKDMTRTFPNLRAVLMVGIGGGVPGTKDVRLGDIVVGSVGRNSSGVIQYDYGRAVQGEEFAVTGHLNQPPMAFLTAMSALHATYEMEGHSIESNIDNALRKYRKLEKKYKRPATSTDRLYKASYIHEGGEGVACSQSCRDENLVHRDERGEDENNPAIHCGLIASGNSLIKDALLRDKLAAKHGILCFEMEAAGLMNHFPCVVIRGICDYSDSHKNDEWQEYAAMTAAAYTKDLLLQIAPSSLQKEERIEALLGQLNDKVEDIHNIATESSRDIKSLSASVHDDAISRWLKPADPSVDHNKARQACHPGTGNWLMNSLQYRSWKSQNNSFVWLNGNSGQGKTILTSTVIEDIRNSLVSDCAILYFYITFTDSQKQSLEAILRSLINQLYHSRPESRNPIISLHSKCDNGTSQANVHQLKSTFRDMLSVGGEVFIAIDALDEYQNRSAQRDELLAWIKSFRNEPVNAHLLVTSRPEHDIKTSIATWADPDSIISLKTDHVGRDISDYMEGKVPKFRWVALQLERLKDCISTEEVNATLETLPKTLRETYYRVLSELTSTRRKYVIRILQILAYSDIPLKPEAAVDAVAINLQAPRGSRFIMKERMPLPAEISSLCSTLFVAIEERSSHRMLSISYDTTFVLQLAHSSVKEFILSCFMTEFDGLLTEPIARLTITEICLVYFLELNYSFSNEDLVRTYPLLRFAACSWIHDASDRSLAFDRWRKVIWNRIEIGTMRHIFPSSEEDEVFYASWSGDESCVKMLLDANATGYTTAWRLDSALLVASMFGHLEIVTLLVEKGADVNANGRIMNVLCTAVIGGHTDIIEFLIKKGADVNAFGNALSMASRSGRLDIVELLINEGADVNAREASTNALVSASERGHLDIVMRLVEEGADVNGNADTIDGTPLHVASKNGHLNIVRYLLINGVDVDSNGLLSGTSLHCASHSGRLDIVDYLIEQGADVNTEGGLFGTALGGAISNRHLNIVKHLVHKGADVNAAARFLNKGWKYATTDQRNAIREFLQSHNTDLRYFDV
ncbi:hypothetical protein FGADI_10725 [Fusarium gaditjirri]|uniref:NACHT domain-containing protein n=1 Tax=Fusarium gaditjirri TaxID=282569 RepID=A0A8H4SWV4_9HYPO|nr:hypothetical protein FGADI_10725 [Fusarium gaditjirri]